MNTDTNKGYINEIDHNRTEEIVCPYCGYEFEDSCNFALKWDKRIDCNECDETFFAYDEVEIYYTTKKIKEN